MLKQPVRWHSNCNLTIRVPVGLRKLRWSHILAAEGGRTKLGGASFGGAAGASVCFQICWAYIQDIRILHDINVSNNIMSIGP
jgi:hypothetical protein